ncbi:unnamed protein product, partial [Closterium sp. NIES-64]
TSPASLYLSLTPHRRFLPPAKVYPLAFAPWAVPSPTSLRLSAAPDRLSLPQPTLHPLFLPLCPPTPYLNPPSLPLLQHPPYFLPPGARPSAAITLIDSPIPSVPCFPPPHPILHLPQHLLSVPLCPPTFSPPASHPSHYPLPGSRQLDYPLPFAPSSLFPTLPFPPGSTCPPPPPVEFCPALPTSGPPPVPTTLLTHRYTTPAPPPPLQPANTSPLNRPPAPPPPWAPIPSNWSSFPFDALLSQPQQLTPPPPACCLCTMPQHPASGGKAGPGAPRRSGRSRSRATPYSPHSPHFNRAAEATEDGAAKAAREGAMGVVGEGAAEAAEERAAEAAREGAAAAARERAAGAAREGAAGTEAIGTAPGEAAQTTAGVAAGITTGEAAGGTMAGEAAGSAVGEAAGSAAGEAVGGAAGEAAESAAGEAAGSAASEAAGSAAGEAAGSAAGGTAGATAGEAAADAAGEAARAASCKVGQTLAGEAAQSTAGEVAWTATGEAAGTAAGEAAGTTADEAAGGTMAGEAAGSAAGEAEIAAAGEAAEAAACEVEQILAGEAAQTAAGEAAGTAAGEAAGTAAREAAGTAAREATGIAAAGKGVTGTGARESAAPAVAREGTAGASKAEGEAAAEAAGRAIARPVGAAGAAATRGNTQQGRQGRQRLQKGLAVKRQQAGGLGGHRGQGKERGGWSRPGRTDGGAGGDLEDRAARGSPHPHLPSSSPPAPRSTTSPPPPSAETHPQGLAPQAHGSGGTRVEGPTGEATTEPTQISLPPPFVPRSNLHTGPAPRPPPPTPSPGRVPHEWPRWAAITPHTQLARSVPTEGDVSRRVGMHTEHPLPGEPPILPPPTPLAPTAPPSFTNRRGQPGWPPAEEQGQRRQRVSPRPTSTARPPNLHSRPAPAPPQGHGSGPAHSPPFCPSRAVSPSQVAAAAIATGRGAVGLRDAPMADATDSPSHPSHPFHVDDPLPQPMVIGEGQGGLLGQGPHPSSAQPARPTPPSTLPALLLSPTGRQVFETPEETDRGLRPCHSHLDGVAPPPVQPVAQEVTSSRDEASAPTETPPPGVAEPSLEPHPAEGQEHTTAHTSGSPPRPPPQLQHRTYGTRPGPILCDTTSIFADTPPARGCSDATAPIDPADTATSPDQVVSCPNLQELSRETDARSSTTFPSAILRTAARRAQAAHDTCLGSSLPSHSPDPEAAGPYLPPRCSADSFPCSTRRPPDRSHTAAIATRISRFGRGEWAELVSDALGRRTPLPRRTGHRSRTATDPSAADERRIARCLRLAACNETVTGVRGSRVRGGSPRYTGDDTAPAVEAPQRGEADPSLAVWLPGVPSRALGGSLTPRDFHSSAGALREDRPQWLRGRCAPAARSLLASSTLVALAKSNMDVRPIAIGEVLVRILSRAVCLQLRDQMARVFLASQQFGVGVTCGTEVVVRGVRRALADHPDWVVLQLDVANAFNSFHRDRMFQALQASPEFQCLIPFIGLFYGTPSDLHYRSGTGVVTMHSERGTRQGDPLSPFLYALTQRLALEPVLAEGDVQLWSYADDTYVLGPPDRVLHHFAEIVRRLGEMGLAAQPHKCLVYQTESFLSRDLEAFTGLGIEVARRGLTVTGVPVGTVSFVEQSLPDRLERMGRVLPWLPRLRQPQTAAQLLSACVSTRPQYLSRTVPPSPAVISSFTRWDARLGETFQQLLASGTWACREDVREAALDQIFLPIRLGGFGIRRMARIAPSFASGEPEQIDRALQTALEGLPLTSEPSSGGACLGGRACPSHLSLAPCPFDLPSGRGAGAWLTSVPYADPLRIPEALRAASSFSSWSPYPPMVERGHGLRDRGAGEARRTSRGGGGQWGRHQLRGQVERGTGGAEGTAGGADGPGRGGGTAQAAAGEPVEAAGPGRRASRDQTGQQPAQQQGPVGRTGRVGTASRIPDLTCRDVGQGLMVLVDVSIADPQREGNVQLRRATPTQIGVAAARRVQDKLRHWGPHLEGLQPAPHFYACVAETFGLLSEPLRQFLGLCAKRIAQRRRDRGGGDDGSARIFEAGLTTRLSVALQRAQAQCMIQHAVRQLGRSDDGWMPAPVPLGAGQGTWHHVTGCFESVADMQYIYDAYV